MMVNPLFFEPTTLKIRNLPRASPESFAIVFRRVPLAIVAEYENRLVRIASLVNLPLRILAVGTLIPGLL